MDKDFLLKYCAEQGAKVFREGGTHGPIHKVGYPTRSELGRYAGILGIRISRRKRSHLRKVKKDTATFPVNAHGWARYKKYIKSLVYRK